jgi:hypothetical protein
VSNDLGSWQPATLAEVARLFASFPRPWWVAGGMAIELAVGGAFRTHDDIDVMVLRRDHLAVREALRQWDLWAADPPGTLRPWLDGETLPSHVHDIWCRPHPRAGWQLQVMIDESAGDIWTSRRNRGIRRPVAQLGHTSSAGLPFLAPEVQLFYKAADVRPKDQQDFDAVLPCLDIDQRRWLEHALAATSPGHPWERAVRQRPGVQLRD